MNTREDSERDLFGSAILLTRAWMSILDAVLKPDGLTAKQWMLLVSIESLGPEAPTLGQTARRYGASHQAVRDVAVRLERRGFLELRRDAHDRRSLRLHLTPQHFDFWANRAADHQVRFSALFEQVDDESLRGAARVLHDLLETAERDESSSGHDGRPEAEAQSQSERGEP